MQKRIKILGIIAIILGAASALVCFLPYGLFLALPIGFLGMVTSTIYVYWDTKYQINTNKFTPGILGIILSSLPIIIILTIIIKSRF